MCESGRRVQTGLKVLCNEIPIEPPKRRRVACQAELRAKPLARNFSNASHFPHAS